MNRNAESKQEHTEIIEKLVSINRVAKVVKGGRRFGFTALVVTGDGKGKVSYSSGKAKEVPEAIRKASEGAKHNLVKIPLREGRTLHHDVEATFGAAKVCIRAAPPGTGIIAGGPMRAILEALGVHDVVGKSIGTSNPHNMLKATMKALEKIASPKDIALKRGKRVGEVVMRRDNKLEIHDANT